MSNKSLVNESIARNGATSPRVLQRILAATLVVIICSIGAAVAAQHKKSIAPSNNLAQQGSTDAANVMFRSGRDLITDQHWAEAQEKFNQYISTFPNEKNIDAALYWRAYAENKLAQYDQCRSTVTKLLDGYPNTSWREDARLLLAQIPGSGNAVISGQYEVAAAKAAVAGGVGSTDPVIYSAAVSPVAVQEKLAELDMARIKGSGSAVDENDPCEFKIVVLQALFQTDVQRGIMAATDWLKPGSTQTVRCKGAALSLLGRNGGKAVTPVILGVAKNDPDVKLRARAISTLGSMNDESVVDALRDFALNSNENDIVEASLYALSRNSSERAIAVLSDIAVSGKTIPQRKLAIASISTRPGEPAVDALLRIYDTDQSVEIRRSVISGFGNRKSERAGTKLLEIARSSDSVELRKAAVSAISRRGGDKVIDNLLSLYDSEKSEEVKDQIMNALGSGSMYVPAVSIGDGLNTKTIGGNSARVNDQRVITKLIEIARNPQTPMERRRKAIGYLSRSKDPQVLKFLEDLLK